MKRFLLGFFGIIVHISFIVSMLFFLIDVIEWIITDDAVEVLYVYLLLGSIAGMIFWLYLTGKDE